MRNIKRAQGAPYRHNLCPVFSDHAEVHDGSSFSLSFEEHACYNIKKDVSPTTEQMGMGYERERVIYIKNPLHQSLMDHYESSKPDIQAKVPLLFYLHASLLVFLIITAVLVILLTPQSNRPFYLSLALLSLAIIFVCNKLNWRGRYAQALIGTILIMFVAPWASILFESLSGSGDVIPMIFVIIPIQIAALFLATKSMLLISGIQTAAVIANIIFSQSKGNYNWVSVVCYVFIASLLGSVTSYLIRTQFDKLLISKEELALNQEKLRDISIRDALSGVYNRRYMDEILDLLTKTPEERFALLMIDIDHFKNVNDTCGHRAGDFVIQTVASFLKSATRKKDIVCRYGGDEFLVILIDCAYDDALSKATEMKRMVDAIGCACDDPDAMHVTASIGVALYPENGASKETLLRAVDMALYQAKEEGRNRIKAI